MSRYEEFDPERLEALPFAEVPHAVFKEQFAAPPRRGASFAEFWDSLPNLNAAASIRTVALRIVEARAKRRAIVFACGAHVVKVGVTPIITALMREGFVTALAMNGATAIHDAEVALFGATSEIVAAGLREGSFGMVRETAEFINGTLAEAVRRGEGAGEGLGRALCERGAPNRGESLLASAYALGIPATVHIAVGTDIVHMHADADGAAYGETSLRDFRILTAAMRALSDGGVLMNIGSAVILPEVLLKAVACLRNGTPDFGRFLGVNLDMIQHYRSNEQVVRRVAAIGGEGISLTGHHEIMIPLLAHAVLDDWARRDAGAAHAESSRAGAGPQGAAGRGKDGR